MKIGQAFKLRPSRQTEKNSFGTSQQGEHYEELAYETVRLEIDEGDCPYGASDFSISVASRDCMSEIIYL